MVGGEKTNQDFRSCVGQKNMEMFTPKFRHMAYVEKNDLSFPRKNKYVLAKLLSFLKLG